MKKYQTNKNRKGAKPRSMQGHRQKKRHSHRSSVHSRIGAGLSFVEPAALDRDTRNYCDAILSLLSRRKGQKTSVDRIASELKIRDISLLYSLLSRLEDEGRILLSRGGLVSIADGTTQITGLFRANRRGFGFVTPEGKDEREQDIFIGEGRTGDAIDGDTVVCELVGRSRRGEDERREGRILRIVERGRKSVIGTLRERNVGTRKRPHTVMLLHPDDDRLCFQIVCEAEDGVILNEGDKVEAVITRYPKNDLAARARVIESFGKSGSREANYAAILKRSGIRCDFPDGVIDEAQRVSAVSPRLTKSRLDLRERVIFTIDGADAKDLDDAISLEKKGSGWLLGVHIADVSHYVRPNSALDDEAIKRGTSVYFTDKVVPMLPRELSNGICSLNEGVSRYTLSALITLDKNGAIKDVELAEAIIRSKVRGVYSEVNDLFKRGKRSEFAAKYEAVADSLKQMKSLYSILKKRSEARGALELETAEAAIILDGEGLPRDIVRRERGDAERMIEQFMLCANEAVATRLNDLGLPAVYRIHDDPDPEKLSAFCDFAHNLGLAVGPLKSDPTPKNLGAVIRAAAERGIGSTVSGVALRSLAKAKYSCEQGKHFGLGIEKYCHFTSPIRRYPDLATHRIIKSTLLARTQKGGLEGWRAFAKRAAELSSENELRAIAAERDIEDLYKCIFMQDKVGMEFEGIISSVTSFGFFVELENTCEGLVPITELDGWYDYDERSMTLSHGASVFSLGARVRVRVVGADIITGKISFRLA